MSLPRLRKRMSPPREAGFFVRVLSLLALGVEVTAREAIGLALTALAAGVSLAMCLMWWRE